MGSNPGTAAMEVVELDPGEREVRLLKKKARIAIAANGGDKLGSPEEDLQCEICGENHNTGYCHHRSFPYGCKFSEVTRRTEEEAKVLYERRRERMEEAKKYVCMNCFIFDHNRKDCPKGKELYFPRCSGDEQLKKRDFPKDEQLIKHDCPEDEHLKKRLSLGTTEQFTSRRAI